MLVLLYLGISAMTLESQDRDNSELERMYRLRKKTSLPFVTGLL